MAIEDTMAQLAHSQVTQSLPSLTNDIQGFQIIDSNDEINSAVGVLVAVVNNLIIYIPAIYRKGKIYSMDVMYIPELRQWLPTQDNWITYLRSRVADLAATLKERDVKSSGGARSVNLQRPLLQIVKAASEPAFDSKRIARVGVPTILKEAASILVEQLTEPCEEFHIPSTGELLAKVANSPIAAKLVNSIANNTNVGNVFAQYYTDDELEEIADKLAKSVALRVTDRKQLPVESEGSVKIVTANSSEVKKLNSEDRVKILKDGAVIVDTRGLVPTKVYKTVSRGQWCAPATSGVYELLRLDGSSLTAYVLVGDRHLVDRSLKKCEMCNDDCGTAYTYVMPLESGMSREFVKSPSYILGQEVYQHSVSPTFGGGMSMLVGGAEDSHYLIVDTDGTALELTDPGVTIVGSGEDVTAVCGKSCRVFRVGRDSEGVRVSTLVSIPAGGKLQVVGSNLHVPSGCRIVRLGEKGREYNNSLKLATVGEYIDAIARRERLLGLKIHNSGSEYTISDDSGSEVVAMSKRAAAYELVKRYAIEPSVAESIIAPIERNTCARYLAKLASGTSYMLSVTDSDPSEQDTESVDLSGQLRDDAVATLQQAGNLGLKEILDVSVLKMLTSDGSSVRLIQDMVPSLFTAMNSIGQILFMLRAGSSLTDAYGDDRTAEMEKQFTKLLQQLGDAIIVLQQGRVNSVEDLLEGPLSRTLG